MKTQRARPVSVMRRTKVQPPYLFDAVAFRRRITAVMAARDLSLRAAAVKSDATIPDFRAYSPTTEVYLRIQAWLAKHAPSRERATKVRPEK